VIVVFVVVRCLSICCSCRCVLAQSQSRRTDGDYLRREIAEIEASVRCEMETLRRTGALSPCLSRDGITECRHVDDVSNTTPFTGRRREHVYDRGATDRMDQIASSASEGEDNGERRKVEHMRGQDR
jgi:hypothetical protein